MTPRVLLVPLLTSMGCNTPDSWEIPANRDLSGWGTLEEEQAAALQDRLDEAVNIQGVPGLQAAVITADGQTWQGAAGTADWDREVPLTLDHRFRIASASKMFTAVLVMQAVEEGRVELDEPVAPWAPEIPKAESITLFQLLSHTSGAPEILQVARVLTKSMTHPACTWEPHQLLGLVRDKDPMFAPGTSWGYSNTNYLALGLVAEQVLGSPLPDLLRERVTNRLGLEELAMLPEDPTPKELLAGWDRDLIPMPWRTRVDPEDTSWATAAWGSGALAMGAMDLALFTDALFTGGLVEESSLEEMTDFRDIDDPGMPDKTGCGLGVFRTDLDGRELWGHDGVFIGFLSTALHDPETGVTLAVVGNVSNFEIADVAASLLEEVDP